ncbi:hypothetical protein ACFV3F_19615 [Streptomyces sp. NPDC059717]|uniref:hypothetical protein n=1 Tax=Streptomyces sp. NPDC059717 TaxID=3346922 RepID=UPI0036C61BCB
MAREPSAEELLQAVGEHVARHGISVLLTSPGAAHLSWQSLLDCRIVRSVEERSEREMRTTGRRRDIAERPAYTDLASHPVETPADPVTPLRLELVREGSLGEVSCEGCEGGRRTCGRCTGNGRLACEKFVSCDGCGGGIDACWECDGTGRPRRRGNLTGSRPVDGPQRARCSRCHRPDAACPKCLGKGRVDCPACRASGFVECSACRGEGRVKHTECAGTGLFTTWTGAVISRTADQRKVEEAAPLHIRSATDGAGAWRRSVLTGVTDKLPDDLEPVHRTLIEGHLALAKNEVGRRVTIRYLPLARVTVHADPDRVYFAFPSSTGIKVVERPSKQRVVRFSAIASTAVAVAVLLLLLVVVVLN